jgi:hypothetical protein
MVRSLHASYTVGRQALHRPGRVEHCRRFCIIGLAQHTQCREDAKTQTRNGQRNQKQPDDSVRRAVPQDAEHALHEERNANYN